MTRFMWFLFSISVCLEMPEWSTDGDPEELGTFDSSGAFVSTQMKPHPKVTAG